MKSSLGRHILSSGIWALVGKIVTTIAGVCLSALIARLLSPDEMGTYFLILSFVTILAVVGRFGMAEVVVRVVADAVGANQPSRAKAAIYRAFQFATVVSIAIGIILNIGLSEWISTHLFQVAEISVFMPLISLWILLLVLHLLIAEIFRGFHDIRSATIFGGTLKNVLSLVLIGSIWLLNLDLGLGQVIFLSIVSLALSNVLGGWLLYTPIAKLNDSSGSINSTEMLNMAWPFMLNGLVIFAIVRANLWVLGAYVEKSDVALYGAALQLVTLVTTPLLLVNAVVPPLIAQMYFQNGEKKRLEGILRAVTTVAGIPSFLMLLLFIFFGGSILALLYGEFYREGTLVLIFLSIGQSTNVWTGPCGALLKMTDNQRVLLLINFFFGLFSIVLSIAVAPYYGVVGVGAVSGSILLLQNLMILFVAKSRTDMWTFIHLDILKIRSNFNLAYQLSLNKVQKTVP